MNKLVKSLVFLFAVALSTSAMAQQGVQGKKLKGEVGARDVKAQGLVDPRKDEVRVKSHTKQITQDVIRKRGVKAVAVK